MRQQATILWAAMLIGAGPGAAAAATIFVDASAPGGGDGTTWEMAYDELQDALARAVPGDAVWVAAATYTPAGPDGDRDATFALPDGVAIYGGFAGGEQSLDERDWIANETILSGDLNGDDGPDFDKSLLLIC